MIDIERADLDGFGGLGSGSQVRCNVCDPPGQLMVRIHRSVKLPASIRQETVDQILEAISSPITEWHCNGCHMTAWFDGTERRIFE